MRNLARAVIEAACFLELSPESIVNQGAAVKALDTMSGTLQECSAEEKQAFIAECEAEAARWEATGQKNVAEVVAFIRSLPEALGVIDET